MNSPRNAKADRQVAHARRRALERFGVRLDEQAFRDLVAQIQAGRTTCVERQSHRVTLHQVTLPGNERAVAVYDAQRSTIVSFLRPEWKEQAP